MSTINAKIDPQVPVDQYGCPTLLSERGLQEVMFKLDSAELTDQTETFLKKKAAYLKSNTNAHYQLIEYTDSTGQVDYNKKLSQNRADVVMDYLINQGVNRVKLTIKWMGNNDSVGNNASEKGRIKNRRVETELINTASIPPQCTVNLKEIS
ncbi:MAG: OmpA family protein [Endozoicomonadaceae bacterium]|nr:OmpA family protein [Endozoicomonadaceae bacterium]